MPINHEFVTVLPQTFPGASGQMTLKMLLQPNGAQVGAVTVALCAMERYLPHQNGSSVSSDGNPCKYRDTGNCLYLRVRSSDRISPPVN
jgi:hypothetical protein